jgi:hypothetical protein
MHSQTNRHRLDELADLRKQKRQIEEGIERAFGAKAVAPFVRQHRATHVIIQEFEND